MNTIEKTLKLILLLEKNYGMLNADEIGRELYIKPRQVRNYIFAFEKFGYKIDTSIGRGGGYGKLKNKKGIPLNVTKDEMRALHRAIDREKFDGDEESLECMERLYLKLQNEPYEFDVVKESCSYHGLYSHKHNESEKIFIGDIQKARVNYQKVLIEYFSANQNSISERVVHPYRVVNYYGANYLVGYCENRNEIRTFKLNRIKMLEVLEEYYDHNEEMKFLGEDNIFGIFNELMVEVIVDFEFPYNEFIKEIEIGSNQEIIIIDNRKTRLKVEVNNITEVTNWLLGFGSKVKIIEPVSLKERILEEAKSILEMY